MHCLGFCVKRSPLSSRTWKQDFLTMLCTAGDLFMLMEGCEFERAGFFFIEAGNL